MRVLCAAIVIAALLVAPARAASPSGHLQGRVRGLPAQGARVFAAARAIDRDTGRVAASTALSGGSRRYRLTVPPGRYFVAVNAASRSGGNFSRLARSVRVRARRTARRDVTARAAQAALVVGVDEINLTSGGKTLKLRAYAINQAFKAFSAQGIKVVDDSAQVAAAMRTEEQLAREGRSDTPFVAHPLKPTVRLAGGGTVGPNGAVTLELKLVRPDGTLVATKTFSGQPGSRDVFGEFLAEAAANLEAERVQHAGDDDPQRGTGSLVNMVARQESWGNEPHGSLTVTPPGLTVTDLIPHNPIFDAPLGSTIHAEAHPTDGQSYFAGWEGSQCGIERPDWTEAPTWDCTVGYENALDWFVVMVVAHFDKCPPPGTFVFGPARTCPGVIPEG